MSDKLTPEALRAVATAPRTPFWEGQARQALSWAADVLEAAETVIRERAADQPEAVICKCDDHDARYCVNRANRGSPCVCRCHGASDTAAHSGAATTTGTPPTSLTNTDKPSAD